MKYLKPIFLIVDIGFITYWLITALHLIPQEYLYNDYTNPILVHWNWSFFPLDIFVSITGLYSIYLRSKGVSHWMFFALVSLILTSVSGLQAIAYWSFAGEFDITWWLPNIFLLLYPIYFIVAISKVIMNKINE